MKKLILGILFVTMFCVGNVLSAKDSASNSFDAFGECTATITTTDEWGCESSHEFTAQVANAEECEQFGAFIHTMWVVFM